MPPAKLVLQHLSAATFCFLSARLARLSKNKTYSLADEGKNHREIARQLHISRKIAWMWRERWLAGQANGVSGVEQLQDEERSGAPGKFELEQILHLFKLACDDPAEYNRPIRQWTN